MTALKTPAADAPAEEWGRLAVAIPDWRWPESCPLPGFFRGAPDGDWQRVRDVGAYGWPDGERVPDPDHWAWEGWLLSQLSADDRPVSVTRMSPVSVTVRRLTVAGLGTHTAPTLGRACIAAAAANGRWPGGEG